jgi:glyoxylase-like metal-dependent hydrolase (beta-lactamase superfamily II)
LTKAGLLGFEGTVFMNIHHLILGEFQTNCYVCRAPASRRFAASRSDAARDCLIIDTGLDAGGLIDLLKNNELNPVAAVFTHGHIDHIMGTIALRDQFPQIKVFIHKLDAQMLTGKQDNLSSMAAVAFSASPADFLLDDGDMIEQAGISLKVLHTPGHTPGGISLYSKADAAVFTGDALFAESVGRTDFPGGNLGQLIKSIKTKLLPLPDETIVYPGHGPATTIAREKVNNPFLR